MKHFLYVIFKEGERNEGPIKHLHINLVIFILEGFRNNKYDIKYMYDVSLLL